MAITYGFYNAVKGSDGTYDRVYNAEQISNMFEGLLTSGVYESVGDAMIVKAKTGMTITVGEGRAVMSSGKWIKNDSLLQITLAAAHLTLSRYSAIVIRENKQSREITITEKAGAAATSPEKPVMTNNYLYEEKCLAYVYVGAGATTISQMNIQDVRANTNLCGWVTGLVEQVNVGDLFLQYQDAYEKQLASMIQWQNSQQAAFEEWYSTLTQTLQVSAYIKKYSKTEKTASDIDSFNLDMNGYTYDTHDVVMVSLNGLALIQDEEWNLNTSTDVAKVITTEMVEPGNVVEITVLKSNLGEG